jgi:hypothetical protein
MKGKKVVKLESIVAGIVLVFGSSIAYAENCNGTDAHVIKVFETTELGENHTVSTWRSHSQIISDNSDMGGTTGECAGTYLSTPDGKTQSMGYCARRDKDGDTYSLSWHTAPGATRGTWKSTGGTGKFAGKQNSGWYEVAWSDGMMVATVWGGNCR